MYISSESENVYAGGRATVVSKSVSGDVYRGRAVSAAIFTPRAGTFFAGEGATTAATRFPRD